MPLVTFVFLLLAAIAGAALGVWLIKGRTRAEQQALEKENRRLRADLDGKTLDLKELGNEKLALVDENSRLKEQVAAERRNSDEKLRVLRDARKELSDQFSTLAQSILDQKSEALTKQNQTDLGHLLNPIREKFGEFQQKVTELRDEGITARTALKGQLENLSNLNERLSAEAANLVRALKGSSKAQGDWGQEILAIVLESSGFTEGVHYHAQKSFQREEDRSRRGIPDIVLNLPDGKHLVVDSKVSLLHYTDYCNATDEPLRKDLLGKHIASIRKHCKDLSEQKYQILPELNSLDFVVMFVPIEPALMLALSEESNLWQEAWEKSVLLASPSTLLFIVRIVDNLWRQEQQSKNVQDIVRRGGELYDKLAAFAKDLTDVGRSLDAARNSYDEACKKLAHGRGNVIRQAEMLKKLGIKPTKSLPLIMVEQAMDSPLEFAAVAEEDLE